MGLACAEGHIRRGVMSRAVWRSAELAELIVRQAARGTYEKTWRQYKVTPYPFYEYWIKQAKWDSRARRAIYGVA